jgi:DNA-binding NtrC family response regulator
MSGAIKILLIEDDPGITDTLQRVLAGEGHEVTAENRGDAGLALAVKNPFNVVITDLRLPGLSGLELIRQLHAARPRLPIILTTAFGTTETAIEATKFGAYDYLLKPFNIPQLLELIQKAANSNRRWGWAKRARPAMRWSAKARRCSRSTRKSGGSLPSRSVF